MRNIYIILIVFLSFISCINTKDLGGKSFSYKSKKRTLELVFENDSICRLQNTFHCNDINSEKKKITINCQYKRIKDTIYLRNLDCKDDNCMYDLTINIPVQDSKSCSFLNEEYRKIKLAIGPSYKNEYQKYV